MNNSTLIVGIDLNQHDRLARLVFGYSEEQILGWRCFRDMDRFDHYWKNRIEDCPRQPSNFHVAIPNYACDHVGIVHYLETKGVPVYRTALTGENHEYALDFKGLPQTFSGAYDLAKSVSRRLNAKDILRSSWLELETMTDRLRLLSKGLADLCTAQAASPRDPEGHVTDPWSGIDSPWLRPPVCPF